LPSSGARALLGASPFAAGAPSNQAHPLVLDMSTAQNDDLHEMKVGKSTSQLGEHLKV